jgi:hypothetical protein
MPCLYIPLRGNDKESNHRSFPKTLSYFRQRSRKGNTIPRRCTRYSGHYVKDVFMRIEGVRSILTRAIYGPFCL